MSDIGLGGLMDYMDHEHLQQPDLPVQSGELDDSSGSSPQQPHKDDESAASEPDEKWTVEEAARWLPNGKQCLAVYHTRVRDLEWRLEELQKELFYARCEADFADHILKGTSFATRAISRVPEELWGVMFEMANTSSPYAWGESSTSLPTSLLTLMLVCRHWHYMLTQTSVASLWNPVEFHWGMEQAQAMTRLGYVLHASRRQIQFSVRSIEAPFLRLILDAKEITQLTLLDFYARHASDPDHIIRDDFTSDLYDTLPRATSYMSRHMMRVTVMPAIYELYIDGGFSGGERFPVAKLPAWATNLPEISRRLDWIWGSERPYELTLVHTITPEDDFDLPWLALRAYAEVDTFRPSGRLTAAHVMRLTNVRVLSLAGVFLPDGNCVMAQVLEFNYLFPWDGQRQTYGGGLFGGLKFPSLEILRLKGGYQYDDNLVSLEETALKVHSDLDCFLRRCPLLATMQLGIQVPYTADILVGHLSSCEALLHLDITIAHPELLHPNLFQALRQEELVPYLQTLRIPELAGPSVDWDDDGKDAAGCAGYEQLEAMAHVRFSGCLKKIDMGRRRREKEERDTPFETKWMEACRWNTLPEIPSHVAWDRGGWLISDGVRARILRLRDEMRWDIILEPPRSGWDNLETVVLGDGVSVPELID
ncbi:hypothetical protein FB451DRAFT_1192801 [Mycena latifolia]|nr:hypothetical protein FB451DRAFT_1192801 [Mycena latifolia]